MMVVYTIKAIKTAGGYWYSLHDKTGTPVAQGKKDMIALYNESVQRDDTPEQLLERLKFHDFVLPTLARDARFK